MIAGLERCIHYRPTAILAALLALTAAALFLFPGAAHAQEEEEATPPATPPAQSVVVSPGESLWSISQERLGPGAPPERVALEVQRIHELNRDRIGDDPGLILPGQRLSLPPSAEEPTVEAVAQTPPARPPKPPGRDAAVAAQEAEERAPDAAVAAAEAKERGARPDPAAAAPPASPQAQAAPRERALPASAGPEGPYGAVAERRQMMGSGILALTLVLAALVAWKLPMRRDVGDAEAWGTGGGYNYHRRSQRYRPEREDVPGSSPGRPARPEGATGRPSAPTKPALIALAAGAKRRKKKRASAAGSPRKGLGVVHDPVLRRALRRSSPREKARDGGAPVLRRARPTLRARPGGPRGGR